MRYLIILLLVLLPFTVQARPLNPIEEPMVFMILQEAVGEPMEGQIAVAGVALDRVEDNRWPDTLLEVLLQPWQFTGLRYPTIRHTQPQLDQIRQAVELAQEGVRPCGPNALWYHTTRIQHPPSWPDMKVRCVIGLHVFFGGPTREAHLGQNETRRWLSPALERVYDWLQP